MKRVYQLQSEPDVEAAGYNWRPGSPASAQSVPRSLARLNWQGRGLSSPSLSHFPHVFEDEDSHESEHHRPVQSTPSLSAKISHYRRYLGEEYEQILKNFDGARPTQLQLITYRSAALTGGGESSDISNNMPINTSNLPNRQPSPANAQQAAQAQTNGFGAVPPAGPASALNLANGVSHAGHQTDINYLWTVVEELSAVLAQNRAQTEGLINGVQRIQSRARENGEPPSLQQVNGELNQHGAVELAELHAKLHAVAKERDALLNETASYAGLLDTYESTFNTLMDKVRHYAAEHANATISLHSHYNSLLEKERETNTQLRIEHGQWQAGLGRAADWARKALKERSDDVSPLETRNRELKAENRILRQLVGWEVEESSDDDDDSDSRGRPSAASSSLQ